MKMLFFLFVLVVISGCGMTQDQAATTPEVPVVIEDTSRLEFVDHKTAGSWEWRILRDRETEKEWLIIHDRYRIVVVPFDGNVPPQQATDR